MHEGGKLLSFNEILAIEYRRVTLSSSFAARRTIGYQTIKEYTTKLLPLAPRFGFTRNFHQKCFRFSFLSDYCVYNNILCSCNTAFDFFSFWYLKYAQTSKKII